MAGLSVKDRRTGKERRSESVRLKVTAEAIGADRSPRPGFPGQTMFRDKEGNTRVLTAAEERQVKAAEKKIKAVERRK